MLESIYIAALAQFITSNKSHVTSGGHELIQVSSATPIIQLQDVSTSAGTYVQVRVIINTLKT